jgi:hypothetical protein
MTRDGDDHRAWRATGCGAAIGLLVLLVAVAPAMAQRPHGVPPGLAKQTPGGTSSNALPGAIGGEVLPTPSVRSFGVWLDDASVLGPREAWLTVSMQRWASPVLRGFDVPVSDVTVGLVPRVHAFASVPFTQYGDPGTPMHGQLGDSYFGAKYVLREPDAGRLGVAATPTVELLSNAATSGSGLSRVNLVLPLSVEWRFGGSRAYGSTGYFTRGAYFAAGALERTLAGRWLLTGALTFARATSPPDTSAAWGLTHQRMDASGSVSWIATNRLVVFGGVGRTLSHMDPDGTRYALSFGTSLDLAPLGASRPPVRP